MKHKWKYTLAASILIISAMLPGCRKGAEQDGETTSEGFESSADATEATIATLPETTEGAQATEPGTVQATDPTTTPTTVSEESRLDAYKRIAEQDAFAKVKMSRDRLIKCDTVKDEAAGTERSRIRMMDKLGNDMLSFTLNSEGTFGFSTVTEDGGLLVVVNRDSGDGAIDHRIIKMSSDGSGQFTTSLEEDAFDTIDYCFEVDGKYYLFGSRKRVNTGILDVYAVKIEPDGSILNTRKIGGGDDTELILVEPRDDGFLLLADTISCTGDFKEINFWGEHICAAVSMDKDLNILEMTKEEPQEAPIEPIGEKAGEPVYSNDPFLQAYGLEEPTLFIDYGDQYLIRGKQEIGRFYSKGSNYEEALEKAYETVYAVYDMDGNVVFREAIDRSLEWRDPFYGCVPGGLPSRSHDSEAWYCDRFRSAGEPPFPLPEGVQLVEREARDRRDSYDCKNVSAADYDAMIAALKADGYKYYKLASVDLLFRDDCLLFLSHYYEGPDSPGGFWAYWYRGNATAPENGISFEEAADLLMPGRKTTSSYYFLHPVDVTPEGFYERTGGQLFIVPEVNSDVWFECVLYYVNGTKAYCSTQESVAVYDVDDDGKDEVLLLSYGPTSGLYTVTLECLMGEDNLDISPIGLGWTFNTDENGRLRLGNSYIGIKDILGEKELQIYEEVIFESIDGEKTDYLQMKHGWGGPNYLKHLREGNHESIRIRSR